MRSILYCAFIANSAYVENIKLNAGELGNIYPQAQKRSLEGSVF